MISVLRLSVYHIETESDFELFNKLPKTKVLACISNDNDREHVEEIFREDLFHDLTFDFVLGIVADTSVITKFGYT
jgi:hypothetical protein